MLTLMVALAATLPARAQFPFPAEPADELVHKTLDTNYGRALMDTFAVSARRNGDPSCLEAKTLDAAALAGHGRALFQRYGSRMVETLNANFDRSAYQSALSASTERNATAELERLARSRCEEAHRPQSARPARQSARLARGVIRFIRYDQAHQA